MNSTKTPSTVRPQANTRCYRLALSLFLALVPFGAAAEADDGYMDHASLQGAVNALASEYEQCSVDVIGSSRQGRGLFRLTLSDNPSEVDKRPALLIVAGIDGRHLVGTETAVGVARRLLANHGDLLDDVTVYVIPRVNPDGAQANLGAPNAGQRGSMRSVDEDRDGAADEDGPDDLNGDGLITLMRRADPPLDDNATHMTDPAAPRLLKKADSSKGERATYSVYTEGLDNDNDGQINEDGPGTIDLDRNFMHEWPEYALDAGPYQLSEPESRALAKFVLEHRNIVSAIVYGRHDNLINVPDGKGKDISGRGPKALDPGDVSLYKEIAKVFKELTGQERAPKENSDGSFHSWLYAQRGIPTFATVVWGRPEPSKPPEDEDEEKDEEAQDKPDEEEDAPKPANPEDAAWLTYSDRDREGAGFIEWQPFEHPTLGRVEIGGFVPGFRMNPPTGELDDLADKQTEFALAVLQRHPKLVLEGPEVSQLGAGLYEIRFGITNEGYLPTATAMARKARSIPPTVVRVSTPIEQVVAGERVSRSWGIDGTGGRITHRWIVLAAADEAVTIYVVNAQLGDQSITFTPSEVAGRAEENE